MQLEFAQPRAVGTLTRRARWRLARLVGLPLAMLGLPVGLFWYLNVTRSWPLYSQCGRGYANDSAAISTLRYVAASQRQFVDNASLDTDRDGLGESGTFGELSGYVELRDGTARLNPPLLSGSFRVIDERGRVARSGYLFRVYLPAAHGVAGPARGVVPTVQRPADADAAEQRWCAYAWPVQLWNSGANTYFVSSEGVVLCSSGEIYGGDNEPPPHAAFLFARDGALGPFAAIDSHGKDGQVWRRIPPK